MPKIRTVLQNEEPPVQNENLVDYVKNEIAAEATIEIFEALMEFEHMKHLVDSISDGLAAILYHESFMTEQLALNDKQKELLSQSIRQVVDQSTKTYLAGIKKDERTKQVALMVQYKLTRVMEQLLSGIAAEVNRGALINCVAVSADTKHDDYNKIELRALKSAGDITIPTKAILVATNCHDIIKHSIREEMKPYHNTKDDDEK